jgi:Nuclease A inhibitor-like protein
MTKRSARRGRAKTATRRRPRAKSAAPPASVAHLAQALSALARALPNPADESTDSFHRFVAAMPPDSDLDRETFRRALSLGSRYEVDLSSADGFFSNASDAENWGDAAGEFRQLEKVMRATLSDISVAFARAPNVVRVRMWLFGRTDDGWLVGLRSIVTET